MAPPLLALALVIRDERARIAETIASARDAVDHLAVLDTGSTDGTPEIVAQTARDLALPCRVVREQWGTPLDFPDARQKASAFACESGATFILSLSGDEILLGGRALRNYLLAGTHGIADSGGYLARVSLGESEWWATRVVHARAPWHYEGIGPAGRRVHEYLIHAGGRVAEPLPAEVSIRHEASDPERRFQYLVEHHLPVLEEVVDSNPEDGRALFFLAQTVEATLPFLGEGERLTAALRAMSLYLRRMRVGGDEEDVRYARLRYLEVARGTGVYSSGEMLARFDEARELDFERPEPHLFAAVVAAQEAGKPHAEVRERALEAARVAEAAWGIPCRFPRNTSCLWRAHYVAARASRKMAIASQGEERARHLRDLAADAQLGHQAGGPARVRDALLSPLPESKTEDAA